MAAPPKNRNRMTHGVRGWLSIGSYPKGGSHVRRIVGVLRTELEKAVLAVHGELTPLASALIQSATRHEGRALLLGRYLRIDGELKLAEKLAALKEIGAATDARDRCLEKLGLNAMPQQRSPWNMLHDPPGVPPAPTTNESEAAA
jgi:hypothetical protein